MMNSWSSGGPAPSSDVPSANCGESVHLFAWPSGQSAEKPVALWFEYVGRTSLILTGPFTGKRYHFREPGARLTVDPRDRPAFLAVPVVRPVEDSPRDCA